MSSRERRLARHPVMSAAAFAALFSGAACASGGPSPAPAAPDTIPAQPAETAPTQPVAAAATTTAPATPPPPPTTTTTRRSPSTARASTTTAPANRTTSTATTLPPGCKLHKDGSMSCAVSGRPLWRRRRWWRQGRELLLPQGADHEAGTEYASVASFAELSLRLIAVGAPASLVGACHAAALDEIRHAETCDAMAGHAGTRFGAIPELLGRRIGRRRLGRARAVAQIAADSYVDGWRNESAAARQLRARATATASDDERSLLTAMAEDEERHAALAQDIVTWCFAEEPAAVSRELSRLAA